MTYDYVTCDYIFWTQNMQISAVGWLCTAIIPIPCILRLDTWTAETLRGNVLFMDGVHKPNISNMFELSLDDLGIAISEDLKPSKHTQAITRKASRRIGMIKRRLTNRSPTVTAVLWSCEAHPRNQLQFVTHGWREKLLDKVQRQCEIRFSVLDSPASRIVTHASWHERNFQVPAWLL